jgi:hypothetical protein
MIYDNSEGITEKVIDNNINAKGFVIFSCFFSKGSNISVIPVILSYCSINVWQPELRIAH